MPIGAITSDIDVTQLVLGAFFLFFIGLVYHLRQEDKREGYPTVDPATGRRANGFPDPPPPKTFRLLDGGETTTPRHDDPPEIAAAPLHRFPGAPLVPTGDPLRDGVGPAAFALRRERPLIYADDKIQVLPMRALEDWSLFEGDADPRGMTVIGADGQPAGVIRDLWIDRSVKILRYLEVEIAGPGEPRRALLPIYYADIKRRRNRVYVRALRSAQFADVPELREPDRITAREEDRINAYYAGGEFYGRRAISGFAS